MTDYVDVANQYVDDVLTGRIPAGLPMRQACQRQRDDLADLDGYTFNRGRANHVCKFLSLLPHTKGRWAREGQTIDLEPWQVFILTTCFGWIDNEGNRRFRKAYVEVARKNAKSTISSGVALYCLTCDNEPGARIVSAATKRDQARLTLDDARQMVDKSPGMQQRFGVETSKHAVYVESSNSNFVSVSKEASTLDGLNPSFVLLDEVHAYKNRELVDVLTSAQGARSQPWLWMITTAGVDLSGIGREEHLYSRKVLDKTVSDERRFAAIFTLDDEDDWQDPDNWVKANPNLGVSVYREHLEQEFTKAMATASAVNPYKTKHLNVWCSGSSALFDMQAWQRCADPSLSPEQFAGEPCVIGLDLASKLDLTAKVKLFERDGHYYVFASHYLPDATVEKSSNSQYQGWRADGWLASTDGEILDYSRVEADILADAETHQVEVMAFDKFHATQTVSNLMAQGINTLEFGQTVLNLSEPTKELEALILAGRIHHSGDPVLAWAISNVTGYIDHKDNVFPRKESKNSSQKIDPAIALIMALGVYINSRAETEPEYQMFVL